MTATCETCRWWETTADEYDERWKSGVRRCMKIPMFWDSTKWDDDGERRILVSDSLAFAQDASDYSAVLLTLPNFGCVMHQPREHQPKKPE